MVKKLVLESAFGNGHIDIFHLIGRSVGSVDLRIAGNVNKYLAGIIKNRNVGNTQRTRIAQNFIQINDAQFIFTGYYIIYPVFETRSFQLTIHNGVLGNKIKLIFKNHQYEY
jgi:hypothetical protein